MFFEFLGAPGWSKLEDGKPDADGIVRFEPVIVNQRVLRSEPFTPQQELAEVAANSCVVVTGTTVKRYSAANAGHTVLYSDWVVKVTKTYKRSPSIRAEPGDEITVTRTGGDMILGGRRVIYTDPTFPEFLLKDDYVFYLGCDPDSSSFLAISGATFDMSGAGPLLLTEPANSIAMRIFHSYSKADFLAIVAKTAP